MPNYNKNAKYNELYSILNLLCDLKEKYIAKFYNCQNLHEMIKFQFNSIIFH